MTMRYLLCILFALPALANDLTLWNALALADADNTGEAREISPEFSSETLWHWADNPAYQRDACAWHLTNNGVGSRLFLNGVYQSTEAPGSYDCGLMGAGQIAITIPVGIVDQGIDWTVPDLDYIPHLAGGADELRPGPHGTRVCGVIAAARDGQGVAGVGMIAPPGMILNGLTDFSEWATVIGLDYCLTNGAKVVCCAWGFGKEPLGIKTLIQSAPSVVFVCAAPNAQQNTDTVPDYPISWGLPNVIGVANLDRTGSQYWSGTGSNVVLLAPGRIISTCDSTGPVYASGTSFSAAYATACIALIASRHGCSCGPATRILLNHRDGQRLNLRGCFAPFLRAERDGLHVHSEPGVNLRLRTKAALDLPWQDLPAAFFQAVITE